MDELRGLTGVKGALPCQYVTRIDHALTCIRKRRGVTAAGQHGSVNVWRDDSNHLRSNFCRHRLVLNEVEHEDIDCLRAWLSVWWPQMGRDEARN